MFEWCLSFIFFCFIIWISLLYSLSYTTIIIKSDKEFRSFYFILFSNCFITGRKLYTCDLCNMSYRTFNSLHKHYKTVTHLKKEAESKGAEPRVFPCDMCERTFNRLVLCSTEVHTLLYAPSWMLGMQYSVTVETPWCIG